MALETLGGIKILQLHVKDGIVESVTVDMGEPVLEAAEIPVLSDKHPVIVKQWKFWIGNLILPAFPWEILMRLPL